MLKPIRIHRYTVPRLFFHETVGTLKPDDERIKLRSCGDRLKRLHPLQDIPEIERPAVGKAMWIDTLVDASIFREWIANVGRRDARTRIAHVLCEFALRLKLSGLGEQTGYQLPMTQEQLGDVTGLTSVHVNRTLKSLEAEGLIERLSPRAITIGDWKKLADAGDFDSNYLHLHENEPALT